MAIITTTRNLSRFVGQNVKIAGSDCCWRVIGIGQKSENVRNVEITETGCSCYYNQLLGIDLDPIMVKI